MNESDAMPSNVQTPDLSSLIASVAGTDEQKYTLYTGLLDRIKALEPPTVLNGQTQTPKQGSISVAAANGVYTVSVTNAAQGGKTLAIYNRVSYSTVQNFGQNVTVLPASPATSFPVQGPGTTLFFRLESSFDQTIFNAPVYASGGAVASGLTTSAAQANNTVLNQSNYAFIDSQDAGSMANVRIFGAAGPYTSYVGVKGSAETQMPSATVVNVAHGSTQNVAFDGEQYRLSVALPGAFPDPWTPTGTVSVVGTGTPTLPNIVLLVQGGFITGIQSSSTLGTGLTQLPTFTITDPSGHGATIVASGLSAGAITGITITNAGDGHYSSTPTVTPAGGVFGGVTGGGQSLGGNNGRLVSQV